MGQEAQRRRAGQRLGTRTSARQLKLVSISTVVNLPKLFTFHVLAYDVPYVCCVCVMSVFILNVARRDATLDAGPGDDDTMLALLAVARAMGAGSGGLAARFQQRAARCHPRGRHDNKPHGKLLAAGEPCAADQLHVGDALHDVIVDSAVIEQHVDKVGARRAQLRAAQAAQLACCSDLARHGRNPLSRRAGSIALPLGPPRRAEVEHWDEAVRCLSVDPLLSSCVVQMVQSSEFRWVESSTALGGFSAQKDSRGALHYQTELSRLD